MKKICFQWCGYIQFYSVSIPDYKNVICLLVICLLVLLGWTIHMFCEIKQTIVYNGQARQLDASHQGRHFNFFLGAKFFFIFFNATGLLKNWKNSTLYVVIYLTLFIVPFFLFSLFFSFLSLFSFFSFFFFFFYLFSFSLGGDGPPAPHPPPPKWRLCFISRVKTLWAKYYRVGIRTIWPSSFNSLLHGEECIVGCDGGRTSISNRREGVQYL